MLCTGLNQDGVAVRSTDGGQVWRLSPGPGGRLGLSCVPTVCTAVGRSALYQTSADGGLIWDTLNAVPDMSALGCRGSAAAPSSVVCLSGGKSNIGKTQSGGQLWRQPLSGLDLNAETVSCVNPPNCVEISKDTYLKSNDNGEIWQNLPPLGSVAAGPASAECLTASYCVAVGPVVYTTLNGGASWWLASVPGGALLGALSCPTLNVCVATAGKGPFLGLIYRGVRTVDPANPAKPVWSWHAYDAGVDSPLNAIDCPTASLCVADGASGVVARSTDGGMIWQTMVTATDDTWATMSCPSAEFCLAGGSSGASGAVLTHVLFATSTDGGVTWTRQPLGEVGVVTATHCLGPTFCMAGATVTDTTSTTPVDAPTVFVETSG